ncbi:HD domain-containing protein [Cytobacillus spongiae]|uniref:HD-GYP domain-containing protein n=1 Tax=Cytobacillus spongiae TaxID=2901381 RepID=UPI001F1D09A7|nr:HD domain-containing phosphohydrolase [Cytobacillus spongiae]UII56250.1 HD domain-containing protein [Cytobacillus spongiae]
MGLRKGLDISMYDRKTLSEVIPGDVILHPLYRSDGLLFITRYKTFSKSIYSHIRKQFNSKLPILTTSIPVDEKLLESLYSDPDFILSLKSVFEIHKSNAQSNIQFQDFIDCSYFHPSADIKIEKDTSQKINYPLLNWDIVNSTFDSERIISRARVVSERFTNIFKEDESLYELYLSLSNYHDVLYIHSINTASITFMIGLSLELSDDELINLSLAALFADIGFINYSESEFSDYLNTGRLDKKMFTEHIKGSVEIISKSKFCRQKDIVYGILDHHEEYSGTGYPHGKVSEDIHLFGRIISIAQKYDELVGGYLLEEIYYPFEALESIWYNNHSKYDSRIIYSFVSKSKIYKLGETIQLNRETVGEVIGFSDYLNFPLHPKVKLTNGKIIDLKNNSEALF